MSFTKMFYNKLYFFFCSRWIKSQKLNIILTNKNFITKIIKLDIFHCNSRIELAFKINNKTVFSFFHNNFKVIGQFKKKLFKKETKTPEENIFVKHRVM